MHWFGGYLDTGHVDQVLGYAHALFRQQLDPEAKRLQQEQIEKAEAIVNAFAGLGANIRATPLNAKRDSRPASERFLMGMLSTSSFRSRGKLDRKETQRSETSRTGSHRASANASIL
jgi:hypothetical protein